MTNVTSLDEALIELLTAPGPLGVIGLADDLISFCNGYQLDLSLTPAHCITFDLLHQQKEVLPHSLPRSAFRALLARFTALCSHSVDMTPYRGTGRIELADTNQWIDVSVQNTKDQQSLDLRIARKA